MRTLEEWKQKRMMHKKKNPNAGMQRFVIIAVAGYLFFFTSGIWFPQREEFVEPTSYYQKVAYEQYRMYLTQFAYSEEDAAMQIIVELENNDIIAKSFEYEAVEWSLGNLKIHPVLETADYVVLRISDVPKNWKQISLRLQEPGKETQAKFYTNKNVIEQVEKLPEKCDREYRKERLKAQIAYDSFLLREKEGKIEDLQESNQEIEKRVQELKSTVYLSEAEAEDAEERIKRGESQVRSNQDTIRNLQDEMEKIQARTENIEEQIQNLKKEGDWN